MLAVWRGNGLLVPVIAAGVFALYVTGAYFLLRPENIALLPDWLLGASLVNAGVVCWLLGRWMHAPPGTLSPRAERLVMYEAGQQHHLYYLKVEYWGLVFVGLGVWWLSS